MPGPLSIERLLQTMGKFEASDLHIKIGSPPILRVASKLQRLETPPLDDEATEKLLDPLVPEHLKERLQEDRGIDFSVHNDQGERFRCSVFFAGGGLHAAIRRVNSKIPEFDELHMPPIYKKFTTSVHEGLVVVCGVTGSGKSSTLAAMINHINNTRQCNIITIEDPVEYAFRPNMSFLSQREVGIDVPDFHEAIRSAVRQDPDVIMVGEMRDRETMLAGLQAAETGHLVFATLHTADAMQAFGRMLEFFPAKDHSFIRSSLASSLRAVAAQRLVPTTRSEAQRVPATEVLLNTSIVSDRIRKGADSDLPAIMAGSANEGMRDFTESLYQLIEEGWIDVKTAEQYSPNVDALHSRIRGIQVKAAGLVSRS